MQTPPAAGEPHDRPVLEPIVVLRPRRTDALAELFRELTQDTGTGTYEPVRVRRSSPATKADTERFPGVRDRGDGRGLRRAAVAVGVAAAALFGFGCALLLPRMNQDAAATQSAPTASAPVDPDGPGTLREGATGSEVTDLQQRLLRIPDVYDGGATDGRYDPDLTEAVARFQLWYGIRGDESGVYGDDTRRELESRTRGS